MYLKSLTFNGERKPFVKVLKIGEPYKATRKYNLLNVPGMAGSRITGYEDEPITIPVDIMIDANSKEQLEARAEEVAYWLNVEAPAPLIFDKRPDRVRYAVVEGEMLPEEFVTFSKVTISFLCPASRKFSIEDTTQVIHDPDDDEEANPVVKVDGTAKTRPIFKATLTEDITYLAIMNRDEYIAVGQPADPEAEVVERHTHVLDDSMGSTTGWGLTDNVTDGYVAGEIKADGIRFYPENFGTAIAPLRWQGPALKKTIPQGPLKDFQMNARIRNENIGWETGMLEVYLLNSKNEQVARIHVSDSWENMENINGRVQLGIPGEDSRFVVITNSPSGKPKDWLNFDGIMTLQREGNRWRLYFAVIDTKRDKRIHIYEKIYIDRDEIATDEITQVQVAFRKWPNTRHTRMSIYHLNIWRINDVNEPQIPIIGKKGDVIEFDHVTNNITINGESLMEYKDLASDFFALQPGENELAVYPANAAKVEVTKGDVYL